MAEVIRIEDRIVRLSPKAPMGPTASNDAVILFFTGIRYERLDDHLGNTPSGPVPGERKKH